ncbi:cytochrome c1 [Thermomonas aquatica]|jgi:ubiquinol-cytochrome c reductase cytochrome c1 subunit|uniref:Cytochrome c1 n=1 Tax=Thermomonas aquatica TaxID=2202149 RepID=A0A5B7ZSB7_9GAMM|nr:cytochrome c1 [Thermomonas aquatica]QDA58074.1 cytochrome c1 [Thermomonas aquatica]
MTKNFATRAATFAAGLLLSTVALANETAGLQQAGTDLDDKASLQRGAQLFMNNCSGCHSLKYLRYARIGEDLDLTEDEVQQNLNLNGGKIGDHVISPMTEQMGKAAFGKAPPDLSVIARVRGSDWIYTYLKSFYLDESRPVGWNNKLFANASMPNPLWEMQGLQQPVYGKKTATGEMPVEGFTISQPGTQTPEQFDQTVRDITAFLEYAGEPAAIKRQGIGVWAVLFLAFFTFIAYLLKKEYWRDVH